VALLAKRMFTAIGLMSGTSMDGIDIAMLRTDGETKVEHLGSGFHAYDPAFRKQLELALETAKKIVARNDRPGDLAKLEHAITARHGEAVRDFLHAHAVEHVDVIGFHGQTVLHRPQQGLTVQLGLGQELADMVGIPVVSDMRANDMLHGGQGAPLVPIYHAALAHGMRAGRKKRAIAFVNIGGIANITFIPAEGEPVAFDTGPGNTLIDNFVRQNGGVPYDAGGAIGSEGAVDAGVLAAYLDDTYFEKPVPKSLDRNDFTLGKAEGLALADGARTLAAVTAHAIHKASAHLPVPPERWILCGGGRKNINIVNELAKLAKKDNAKVELSDQLGFDGDTMEAEAWAYLAVRSLRKLPLSFPLTTGVKAPVSGGVLVKPRS
jgi:anhydro-N-acetylmuramic acid kinase